MATTQLKLNRFVVREYDAQTYGVWDNETQCFVKGLASSVYRAYDRKCAVWYALECAKRGYAGPDRY